MRTSLILALLILAAAAFGETPTHKVYGFCYGPFVGVNENPELGDAVTRDRVAKQIKLLAPYCKAIRTYGSTHGLQFVAAEARKNNLVVWQGAWIGADRQANEIELDLLIDRCNKGLVDVAIIGSETQYRHDISPAELVAYIRRVKVATKGKVPVTTDDTAEAFTDKNLIHACDLLMVSIYPYWQGAPENLAAKSLKTSLQAVRAICGSKKIVIGESGWPMAGKDVGQAKADPKVAAAYLADFVQFATANKIKYFVFEAFDEPWKGSHGVTQEAHLGIFSAEGKLKASFRKFFFPKEGG